MNPRLDSPPLVSPGSKNRSESAQKERASPRQAPLGSVTERGEWKRSAIFRHFSDFSLSVIVPVRNERENLPLLLSRLLSSLEASSYAYEVIFIDDRSDDGTAEYLESLATDLPVRVFVKEGRRGKAFSILEGVQRARGNCIAIIDGDLQYPPEAIVPMVRQLETVDVVVGHRTARKTSWVRSLFSHAYRFVFGRLLFGLAVDVQSGLKVMKRETIVPELLRSVSAWGFDYHYLFHARRMGFCLGEHEIIFADREHGRSHVRLFATSIELAAGALLLRLKTLVGNVAKFLHYPHSSEYAARGYRNTVDFLFLPEIFSIKKHLYAETVTLVLWSLAAGIGFLLLMSALLSLPIIVVLSGVIALLYLVILLFKLWVVKMSVRQRPLAVSARELKSLRDRDLPLYTILIPLYKEAEVIPQIISAMSAIDYPAALLDIIITLEEYDHETIDAIKAARPPAHFKTLILPDVQPKTKPKALNVAFLQTKGEFLVIYDAEIVPDADQLKKAVAAFRRHPEIACLQTRLDHYNPRQSWVTKLFNAEFSFYYDLFLPGLQARGYSLPLSGHSTHFRRSALADIGAWDPYNLTEDCDVGIRLFRKGYRTEILDSVSLEEATTTFESWVGQRSRWMKGFIQTTIVHLRHPLRLLNDLGGYRNFVAFLFIVPGSVVMNVMNSFYWLLLGLWLATHSPVIKSLFPGAILYVSILSFIAGNFLFTYLNLLGVYERRRFDLVKYSLLSCVYWIMLSYATVRACIQLLVKPHHWEKTKHGRHLRGTAAPPPIAGLKPLKAAS